MLARGDAELSEGRVQVRADGPRREEKLLGNLSVAQASSRERADPQLLRREDVSPGRLRVGQALSAGSELFAASPRPGGGRERLERIERDAKVPSSID